jgi:hypothetical protein
MFELCTCHRLGDRLADTVADLSKSAAERPQRIRDFQVCGCECGFGCWRGCRCGWVGGWVGVRVGCFLSCDSR